MDFDDRNTWTTFLGLPYIEHTNLEKLNEKLSGFEQITDLREKIRAVIDFLIECRKLSAPEWKILNGDNFNHNNSVSFPEEFERIQSLFDPSAKLRAFLRFAAESEVQLPSD